MRHVTHVTDSDGFDRNRRRFLRGLGALVGLPLLESFRPSSLHASNALATATSGAPLRTAFVYFPNGANQDHWFPTGEGREFTLGKTMEPLRDMQSHFQVIAGLEHVHATAGPDGAGDHARANATFLTGARARKTAGADIFVGESIDQLAARRIGELTRFPSLELSCDAVRKSGGCDSGYSCAYQYNISWRSPTSPMTPEPNPRLVFERLFGDGTPGGSDRKSLLDFVQEDARSLQAGVSTNDRRKLDEYLTGVRELELRIKRADQFGRPAKPELAAPAGIPDEYGEHMKIMFELLALAFQTDSTRMATLMLAGDGTNRAFPQIGIPEGHHFLTHQNEAEQREKVARIDQYYVEHFAGFLRRLAETQDVNGESLLHNSMIVYGCGIGDGNRHNHDNLPVILAGGGGGSLRPGQYVKSSTVPMTNLYLSLMDRIGLSEIEQFGDSTGRLEGI